MMEPKENLKIKARVEITKLPKKVVVVLSGGLDSTTLLHYVVKRLGCEVYPISFYYGQKHDIELKMANWQVEQLQKEGYKVAELKVVDMSFMKDLLKGSTALVDENIEVPTLEEVLGEAQPITYVPYRNLVMLSIALSYAEAKGCEAVFYGAQRHDEYAGYWDTTWDFVEKVNEVSMLNREHKIRILAPFVDLHKWEEIVIGKELSVDYSKTHTCYRGDNCGVCSTCRERVKSFAIAGIPDPLQYKVEVNWNELIAKYKKDLKFEEIEMKILNVLSEQLS